MAFPPPPPGPDYASVADYLFGLKAQGVKFGIDRMRALSEALGHPERRFPVLHIAGTNGKGSVSAMLEAIFRAAGWKTGLYTSPHLVRLGERVQVDRQPLTEAQIIAYVQELHPVARRLAEVDPDDHPSFFEFMTAMAFLHFARRGAEIGIIEVGLGGRLDATNVVEPEVTAITSIGRDHIEMLGDSLERIAAEKGGIVKPGRPVVLGRLPAVAEETIRRIAAERGAPVTTVREVFGEELSAYPQTNLEGDHQRWNAATATLVARQLPGRWRLTPETIARGLHSVNWPGRWQRLSVDGRALILDASHNPEGAGVLETHLRRLVAETGRAPIVVTGVLGEYRARALLEVVARHAAELFLVMPQQSRASDFETLERCVPSTFAGRVHRSSVAELFPGRGAVAVGQEGETVVVTGSIYLLGEVLERIAPHSPPGEGRLQDF